MSQATGSRTAIRRIGVGMYLAASALFIGVFFLGGFEIDATTWEAIEQRDLIQDWHEDAFLQGMQPALDGKRFATPVGFFWALRSGFAQAEEIAGEGKQFSKYNREEYGLALARLTGTGPLIGREALILFLTLGLAAIGGLLDFLPRIGQEPGGIKNNGVWSSSFKSRGLFGILFGIFLIGLYLGLYFYPALIVNWIRVADPAAAWFGSTMASRWFFYGFLYTLVILVMGVRMLVNYRHSRYHVIRTASVMFFQLGFAFLIPEVMYALNKPGYDFKNAWPLDYDFFYSWNLDALQSSGALGWFILFWGIGLSVVLIPVLAAFFGKRWYCSWVCGCGGLAETLGDPFRHLSDKSLRAWKVERWLIHGVLVFAVVMTGATLANYLSEGKLLGEHTATIQFWYGLLISSIFAGVVGTGFYPFMGNRVWCRFGCPLAAILGMVQKFKSRFRITTNGGQCISCGNCSTYCEMGIDVRWYAQRGQNIIRSSCVGCGVCAAVCPRGVLRLENGPEEGRYNEQSLLQIVGGNID